MRFEINNTKVRSILKFMFMTILLSVFSISNGFSQCQAVENEQFNFLPRDTENSPEQSMVFLLTDFHGDIIKITSDTFFIVEEKGLFELFGFSYDSESDYSDIILGQNVRDLDEENYLLIWNYEVIFCSNPDNPCDITNGVISFQSVGGNQDLTTKYILTTLSQEILKVNSEPHFENISTGEYFIFSINYDGELDLDVGNYIDFISGICYDIGLPIMFNSCFDCVVSIGDNIKICGVQTLVLTANALTPGNYEWSTGETGKKIIITPEETTAYSVTFTGTNGCVSIDEITVTVLTPPTADAGNNKTICPGESTTLSAVFVPGASYSWNTGQNTREIEVSPISTTTYTVEVSLGECSSYDVVTVFVNPLPDSNIAGEDMICLNSSTELSVSAGNIYEWSTGESTSSIEVSPTETTTYSVTVTSNDGCNNITINEHTVNVSPYCGGIDGQVWEDINGNGIKDYGEPTLSGVVVQVASGGNTIAETISDLDGNYYFDYMPPSEYNVLFVRPAGYMSTFKDVVSNGNESNSNPESGLSDPLIISQDEVISVNSGYFKPGTIGNFVWEDINRNGVQDVEEPGISNFTVILSGTNGIGEIVSETVLTDSDGYFQFENIYPGNYYVTFSKPEEYRASPQNSTSDTSRDSDADEETGESDPLVIVSGYSNLTLDAGFYRCNYIGDFVWLDEGKESNVQDMDDTGFDGVTIYLYKANNPTEPIAVTESTTQDNKPGFYQFEVCDEGYFYLKVDKPENYGFVMPNAGNNENDSKVNDTLKGTTSNVYIGYATQTINMDIGLAYSPLPVTIIEFAGYWDKANDVNRLKWTTSSETNNDYFEVQRSFEGEPFSVIGKVEGQGNSTEINSYHFNDEGIMKNGVYSYRLRQVDYDGQYRYSDIIKILVSRERSESAVLYPNPTNTTSLLEIQSDPGSKIQVGIYDAVGKLFMPIIKNQVNESGVIQIDLSTHNVPQGVYHLKVGIDDKINTIKWIVIK